MKRVWLVFPFFVAACASRGPRPLSEQIERAKKKYEGLTAERESFVGTIRADQDLAAGPVYFADERREELFRKAVERGAEVIVLTEDGKRTRHRLPGAKPPPPVAATILPADVIHSRLPSARAALPSDDKENR